MTPEQIDILLKLLADTPTQGILWFVLFWGIRQVVGLAKERIQWLQSQLEKYMDRDRDTVTAVLIPEYKVQIASRWAVPPPLIKQQPG